MGTAVQLQLQTTEAGTGCQMSAKSREILRKFKLTAVQGHPRSSIMVLIESAYANSYYWSLTLNVSPPTVFEILTRLARK